MFMVKVRFCSSKTGKILASSTSCWIDSAPKDSKSEKGAAKDHEEKAASDSAEDSDWELASDLDEQSEKEAATNQAQQNKDANWRTETSLAAAKFVELMPQHLSPEQFQELRRSHEECWRLKGQEIRRRWELKEREE